MRWFQTLLRCTQSGYTGDCLTWSGGLWRWNESPRCRWSSPWSSARLAGWARTLRGLSCPGHSDNWERMMDREVSVSSLLNVAVVWRRLLYFLKQDCVCVLLTRQPSHWAGTLVSGRSRTGPPRPSRGAGWPRPAHRSWSPPLPIPPAQTADEHHPGGGQETQPTVWRQN